MERRSVSSIMSMGPASATRVECLPAHAVVSAPTPASPWRVSHQREISTKCGLHSVRYDWPDTRDASQQPVVFPLNRVQPGLLLNDAPDKGSFENVRARFSFHLVHRCPKCCGWLDKIRCLVDLTTARRRSIEVHLNAFRLPLIDSKTLVLDRFGFDEKTNPVCPSSKSSLTLFSKEPFGDSVKADCTFVIQPPFTLYLRRSCPMCCRRNTVPLGIRSMPTPMSLNYAAQYALNIIARVEKLGLDTRRIFIKSFHTSRHTSLYLAHLRKPESMSVFIW